MTCKLTRLTTKQTMPLTIEEQAATADTWRHIHRVQHYLFMAVERLMHRAHVHDQSKLESPEVELFTRLSPRLKGSTYGTPEYDSFLKELRPALDHHYAHNRHHPEHYADGIGGMDLLDLVEMLCDWKAAGERHGSGGDIMRSIEVSAARFGIDPQLRQVLENTAYRLFLVAP